jgi:alpha-N-arabinofuranosidase
MTAHNPFSNPDAIRVKDFSGIAVSGGTLTVELPPMSVVTVELR